MSRPRNKVHGSVGIAAIPTEALTTHGRIRFATAPKASIALSQRRCDPANGDRRWPGKDVIDCAALPSRIAIILIVLTICMMVGCVRVKPYEREHLARRSMAGDRAPGDKRFEQHQTGSREGADGGTGEPGGGCGCN